MMMSNVTPAVVLKTRFVLSNNDHFKDYIDYVDRDDAKQEQGSHEKLFSLYQDYMDNPDKTSDLFTSSSYKLSKEEKKDLKKQFETAQENKSIMWQDVISFDNKWLQENGIYDSKTHTVDEKKLIDVTRMSMNEMLKREGLEKSAVWSGAIHFNTDNIHIHVATVEPNPTRERGKRKPKTLDAMKSKVVNNILDRSQEQKKINDLIRKNMVESKKNDSSLKWKNRDIKPLFKNIYNNLPEDKKQWNYANNSIKHLRPHIDEMTKKYIEKHHKKDYNEFIKKLDKEVDVLRKTYGEGSNDKKRYENYKQNKVDDLYKRMGNAFLKEMRDYDKQQQNIKRESERKNYSSNQKSFKSGYSLNFAMKKMEKAFSNEYDSWKNQRHYEKLQRDIEYENER